MLDNTLQLLLKKDPACQRILRDCWAVEGPFQNVAVSEDSKAAIEKYFNSSNLHEMEFATLCHLAGIINGFQFARVF